MHIHQFFTAQLFDDNECDRILDITRMGKLETGTTLAHGKKVSKSLARNCELKWIAPTIETQWIFQGIGNAVRSINDQTLKFVLDGGMEPLQYLEYGVGHYYGHHTDNSDDKVATRKFTAVVQLSDPKNYIGGSLRIEGLSPTRRGKGFNKASKQRGTLILFPSHLNHVAMPVWWGRRKCVVCWFHGKEPLR